MDWSRKVPIASETTTPTWKTRKENYFRFTAEVGRGPLEVTSRLRNSRNWRINVAVIDDFHYLSYYRHHVFIPEPCCTILGEFISLSKYPTQKYATKNYFRFAAACRFLKTYCNHLAILRLPQSIEKTRPPHRVPLWNTTSGLPPRWKTAEVDWVNIKQS